MKILTLCFLLCTVPLLAQTTDNKGPAPTPLPAGMDENVRLMQEYMARRAEWLDVRRATLDKVKVAKNDKGKQQQLDKLAEDEKPLLTKMGEAARAYQAAEKAKRDAQAASKPRG